MYSARALFLLALPFGVCSQSVSSCGSTGDHLSDVKITLSPDPIAKGKPFTIDLSGNLDASLSEMNADVDLTVKALGIIDKAIKVSSPLSISPGLVAGAQSISIGPLTLPSLPGDIDLAGTIKITNSKKEPVACMNLNLNVPAESDRVAEPSAEVDAFASGTKVSICSAPADHLHNIAASTAAGVTTITGTLDEDVTKFVANLDLKVHVSFISHAIKMAVPISYSPGLVKGDLKITAGPAQKTLQHSNVDVDVTGTIKIDDGASQELVCLSLAPAEGSAKQDAEGRVPAITV
eukprot:TRINITY_DN2662_c0_g1_i2.p2 TRINITY_DN2662_c0_g1~~TRINITY_DN2662_c0_g1_i2.p2  ORF type:complete len:292 (-),score=53.41 TRINITY_DN2662_c0_g1_i2:135-1010(-)